MNVRTGFVSQPGIEPLQAIERAAVADLEFVELQLEGDSAFRRLEGRRDAVAEAFDAHDLDVLVHLPFTGVAIGSPHEHVREGAITEIESALEFAATLDAEKAVIHGSDGVFWSDSETVLERCLDPLERVDGTARDAGIELCVENTVELPTNRVATLLEETAVSVTLDTGHARAEGLTDAEIRSFADRHADRISHVHLNDTRGDVDEHLPFGSGTFDFEALFDALGSDWTGTLSLEVFTSDLETIEWSASRLHELL